MSRPILPYKKDPGDYKIIIKIEINKQGRKAFENQRPRAEVKYSFVLNPKPPPPPPVSEKLDPPLTNKA